VRPGGVSGDKIVAIELRPDRLSWLNLEMLDN
jgi:hypothetical protein